MLLLLNLPLVGIFARVATIPPRYLMPGVLVLCAVAAYSDNNNPFDVWVMVGAGVLGPPAAGRGADLGVHRAGWQLRSAAGPRVASELPGEAPRGNGVTCRRAIDHPTLIALEAPT
jgi:hypothetical protein